MYGRHQENKTLKSDMSNVHMNSQRLKQHLQTVQESEPSSLYIYCYFKFSVFEYSNAGKEIDENLCTILK